MTCIDLNKFFIAQAPGSLEFYLIPNELYNEYLKWCQCEFFDEQWRYLRDIFKDYEIIYKNA